MKKYKYLIIGFFTFISSNIYAQKQDSVFTNASMNKAVVYFNAGADMYHTAKANLSAGIQDIVINNIATELDLNTLQISCPENITILSSINRTIEQPVAEKNKPLLNKWQDSLKSLEKQLKTSQRVYEVAEGNSKRISDLILNSVNGTNKSSISSDEIIKLTNFYTDKISTLKEKLNQLEDLKASIAEKINEVKNKINELMINEEYGYNSKQIGQIILHVLSKSPGAAIFDFHYYISNAGWTPSYDIRVKSIDNSMRLLYKAMLHQQSGMKWDNVKLTLSTSNPNLGNAMPVITPTYLQLFNPILYQRSMALASAPMAVQVESFAPQKKAPAQENDEAPVVAEYLTLQENQLNANYEIDVPYIIPCYGNSISVNIREEKMNANYEHYSIPKLNNDVFFTALISEWDTLNLLSGEANIIMDNVYTSKTTLNPNTIDDTMKLSLGVDQRVSVTRTELKDFTEKKRNDNKLESHTYEIIAKNNKKQTIQLLIKDQYPISKTKDIEINLKDNEGATVDAETGILMWRISLNPGETKKMRFNYDVKYPKDKQLQEVK